MKRYRNPSTQLKMFEDELPREVEHEPLYAAEAFSGGGLFGLGFLAEGIDVGEVCELDKHAVETLRFNVHHEVTVCDALKYTPAIPPGGVDIMFGGPPCQPFSRLGARKAKADPRFLLDQFIRWAEQVAPRVIVMENVTGLLEPDNIWIVEEWFQDIAAKGYDGSLWKVLAADYGTPQLRPRIFMVAWPKGAPWGEALRAPPPPTHAPPDQALEAGLLPWVSAHERLISGCCGRFGLYSCAWLNNTDGICDFCRSGSSYAMAANEIASEGGRRREKVFPDDHPFFPGMSYEEGVDPTGEISLGAIAGLLKHPERIQSRHQYVDLAYAPRMEGRKATRWVSPTLTRSYAGGVPMGLLLEPGATFEQGMTPEEYTGLRRMTVREAAKLMDVPQWYQFQGPVARRVKDSVTGKRKYIGQYAQVGNGVPVNLARAVARHILRAFGRAIPQPGSLAEEGYGGLWQLEPGVGGCASYKCAYENPRAGLVQLTNRAANPGDRRGRGRSQDRQDPSIAALKRKLMR
jgi:site-specific DNA-cytosine methylase